MYLPGMTPSAPSVCQNIHQYNTALAFTLLRVEVDNSVNEGGGGPPTFQIHGKLCHRLGSLTPLHGDRPAIRVRLLRMYEDPLDSQLGLRCPGTLHEAFSTFPLGFQSPKVSNKQAGPNALSYSLELLPSLPLFLPLGARGYLPGGHIEVTLRFLKQFVHTLPRGYMLDSFTMYPPL